MVIVDTGFLSSFFKIGKLKFVLKVFNLKCLIIPTTVYEELKEAKFFEQIMASFAFRTTDVNDNQFILVKSVDLNELKECFQEETKILGNGELGCFLLAKKTDDKLLIDDQKARAVAKEKGLKVVSITTFLLYCKKKKILSLNEIIQIIKELKEKDYYELSNEVKEMLLK